MQPEYWRDVAPLESYFTIAVGLFKWSYLVVTVFLASKHQTTFFMKLYWKNVGKGREPPEDEWWTTGYNRSILPEKAPLGCEIQPKHEHIGPRLVEFRIKDPKFAAGSTISWKNGEIFLIFFYTYFALFGHIFTYLFWDFGAHIYPPSDDYDFEEF